MQEEPSRATDLLLLEGPAEGEEFGHRCRRVHDQCTAGRRQYEAGWHECGDRLHDLSRQKLCRSARQLSERRRLGILRHQLPGGRRRFASAFIQIKSRRNSSTVTTSRLHAPSDLLYETNTITFCSVIRGRYGLTGRCSFEHRNWNPSAERGYQPAGAGRGGTTSGLRATSRGARGPACHCGPSARVLWLSPSLVWLPRMGTPRGLASPLVTSACDSGQKAD